MATRAQLSTAACEARGQTLTAGRGDPCQAGAAALFLPISLIGADDKWALWAVIAVTAAAGVRLERTAVGRALSGAVCAMLITSILSASGVLPATPSPHVASLQALFCALHPTPCTLNPKP